MNGTATRELDSPWMSDYTAARELQILAAQGVKITTAEEHFDGNPGPHGAYFLHLQFPTTADVSVWYDDTVGSWVLEVRTFDEQSSDPSAQVAQAANIADAARICRDFNNRIIRRAKNDGNASVTNEIAAMLADRGIKPYDIACAMGLTPGVLASKLAGRTGWTGVDLLRVARLIAPDDATEVIERLASLA